MLSLRLGSILVNTAAADIPVVLRNPLFTTDEGKIPGSFIFNFTLPLTDELKAELAHAHRPARKGKPTWTHPYELRFGIIKYAGTANITEINHRQVEVNMPVDLGSLTQAFGNTRLRELAITNTIPWDPKVTFADVTYRYEYAHEQSGIFVHDVWLEPTFVRIDGLGGWNAEANSFTAPANGDYRVTVVVNSAFGYATYLGSQVPLVGHRSFRIYKNGTHIVYTNIDDPDDPQEANNSYGYDEVLSLLAGDVLTFAIYAGSRLVGSLHYLYLTVDPGTTITIDNQTFAFATTPANVFPDVDFAVFPYHNPDAMGNVPDSLFQVDISEIKDYLSRFAPCINYYRGGVFPWVSHGQRNGIYYSLLNLFSPAPYLAGIINHVFAENAWRIVNNVFTTADLNTIACITPDFINNYFPTGSAPLLKTFFPDAEIRDFLRNVCHFLGIVFKLNPVLRTITFQHVDDIINDTTSVEFSTNIANRPQLRTEDYDGYILRTQPPQCNYISTYHKSLDGLTIKGEVNLWNSLPGSGNEVNDAYFVKLWRAWFIWNYDPDFGVYNWIFHSIDYSKEVSDYDAENEDQAFKLELPLAAPAAFVYHPEYPNTDPTIGAASRAWHIPAFHQAGNFENLPQSYRSEPGYALIHYRGLHADSNAATYPLGSNDVYKYNGDKITGADLALRPDGTYGLYEKRWKSFMQWRVNSAGEYTLTKLLTPVELAHLDWFRWHKILGVDYIIKEIRFNIRPDHLTLAEILAHRR